MSEIADAFFYGVTTAPPRPAPTTSLSTEMLRRTTMLHRLLYPDPAPPCLKLIIRQAPVTLVPARTHRKKRIRNKWRNRYGMVPVAQPYNPREILRYEDTLLVYPEMAHEIQQCFQSTESPGTPGLIQGVW